MGHSSWPLTGNNAPAENPHPYYPLGVSIPDYLPNEAPVPVLLAALGGMLGFSLLLASVVARKANPDLGRTDLAVFCWFVMMSNRAGCSRPGRGKLTSSTLKGYFVLNHATVASSQNLLAQLWKEYALSDSRYLTSDVFMLSVESITAFIWGPLCLATALSIVLTSPLRHSLRITASMAHLYGVALYYATSLSSTYFTGRSHSRPEVLYFWVYYVGFNLPWAVIPALLLLDSVRTVTRAMRAPDLSSSTHRPKEGAVPVRNGSMKSKVI
ncbi:Uu.00g003190.m01.CDS01 [Anthostomella pinea]|uniref:Uu.00g003190.m01.CDS01 n=1 Tax=Anthostomella pinea TaxID=933095 RepID=A0AAI8VJM4_9PEZI|nr:Uu.00g003190.m01.CDS01 [Anthostomella pinea]